ncbi:ScbA/BarX family gamma-butyrolactone biosynthesis protein [Streptomyces coeruleoprunus]|uniref:ScbA/BarX family gamma-butyrolactone biosynthesis protein n=1 Tax=Streptomyces coeruleoprunus TaxID=285563 RepID=A0ABV9XKR7_9ACTN
MHKSLLGDRALRDVRKEYVHLHDADAVLVTGWSPLGDDRFAVTARWPEATVGAHYEPLLLTQTIRQSCLLVAHAECGVPLSHQTLMDRMDFSVADDYRIPRHVPAELLVVVDWEETGRRSARMRLSVLHDGRKAAESLVEFSWIAPSVYARLRGDQPRVPWGQAPVPAPLPAHMVGRDTERDVVLAATHLPGRWELRYDVGNTTLYDHPVDHVPGLVLLEAAYQAARAAGGPSAPVPHAVTSTFDRYVEFDAPCWIAASVIRTSDEARPALVEVVGVQQGEKAFRITLS